MKREVVLFYPRPWPGTKVFGRIPYALLHLSSYIGNQDFNIKIIDERLVQDMSSLLKTLDKNVLCFGISSFTGIQISNGIAIARQLRSIHPGVPIVWGGWHPSCMPHQTLQHELVDIIVRGQGEETFKELLHALSSARPLSSIAGISYKAAGQIMHNPDRELLPVLENIRLDYNFDVEKYIYHQPWGDRAIGMITSLGCPYSCGFCAVANVYKRRTFYRNIDFVLDEIDDLVAKHGINAITFDDDNFFVSPRRIREFCEKLVKKPYRIAWDAGAHVGLLLKHYDQETLNLVKESGCKQLYIGAESGSEEVLRAIEKKAIVSETFEYVQRMKTIGIKSFLSTMVCFPGVSSQDIYETIDMIIRCRDIDPNIGYRLFYYTPYPATPLYKTAVALGMKEPDRFEEWAFHTLRKFKAPWILPSHRKLLRHFLFYYFPYSSSNNPPYVATGAAGASKLLNFLYRMVFANKIFLILARLRVKHRYFKWPVDAYIVMMGERIKSLYIRWRYKTADLFADYED